MRVITAEGSAFLSMLCTILNMVLNLKFYIAPPTHTSDTTTEEEQRLRHEVTEAPTE